MLNIDGEKIVKIACGSFHSLFLTSKNKLFAIGQNKYGQCGHSSVNQIVIEDFQEIFADLLPDEKIVDIQAG